MSLASPSLTSFQRTRPLRAGDVQLYEALDLLTEGLIYAMVLFSPWAFGTTQPLTIWLMNAAGYFAGTLLACKVFIRRYRGYQPPRWSAPLPTTSDARRGRFSAPPVLTATLAGLSLALLGYCLLSALNARATFDPAQSSFHYKSCLRWLPHSLDSHRTWLAFRNYLGLACAFWAMWDWLQGKTEGELRTERLTLRSGGAHAAPLLSARVRRLLWVLGINGALLALEGIVQRLEGSGNLLFLVKPRVNPDASTQFGPYAYRSNASQYFNLVWPVCLGFWWTLNQALGFRHKRHHLLLIACIIMAACPIISTSRGGALVTFAIVVLGTLFLLAAYCIINARRKGVSRLRKTTLLSLLLFLAASLTLGLGLGWKTLKPRLAQLGEGFDLRERMYSTARPMAEDYPVFGTGPGTFETVFQLYRTTTDTYWPAQLHNDWLETRITFGWVGSALIAAAFSVVALRWFARGGIPVGGSFVVLIWIALAGCLVHARYDFPFQIHSILFLFLLLCALLFSLTRRA